MTSLPFCWRSARDPSLSRLLWVMEPQVLGLSGLLWRTLALWVPSGFETRPYCAGPLAEQLVEQPSATPNHLDNHNKPPTKTPRPAARLHTPTEDTAGYTLK